MVRISKMFKKGQGGHDEASVFSKLEKRLSRRSPSPSEQNADVAAADPAAMEPGGLPPVAPSSLPSLHVPKAARIMQSVKKLRGSTPTIQEEQPPQQPAMEEARDEAPCMAGNDVVAEEPSGREEARTVEQLLGRDASASADEGSFEEGAEDQSQAYAETGTVETYEEEEEEEEAEEEEEELTNQGTNDDESYEGESYAEATYDETVGTNAQTDVLSVGTAKGEDITQKYFHKDVVLNSLEDGANSLVIRAMYFIPKPKSEDHVVVKIEASTISARDCMKCQGHGLTGADLPFVPGYEVVGTIQTLGEQARANGLFREGDRVAGVSTFGGGNSRFISIPSSRLTKISNEIKSTQAVCMITDYMAALRALRMAKKAGSPFTGMNILITDGFSPIGQAVIGLASMEGANIYCCADESKHSYLASLGAKCFVKDPEVWLPAATGTFDVVIDNSCTDSYTSSWFAINQKGSLVCIAPVYNIINRDDMPNNGCGIVDVTELRQKWAGLKAKYMMSQTSFLNTATCYDDDTDQYKQDLRYLMFLLERGDVKPKVAERVSLDDVPDAQRLMQSGRANGTVVCVPWIEG